MANIVFNKLLTEDGVFILQENSSNILLEDQQNVTVIVDYTHVAYVDQMPRTVYITKGV